MGYDIRPASSHSALQVLGPGAWHMVADAADGSLTISLPLGTSISDWCGTVSIAALVRGQSVIAAFSVDVDGQFALVAQDSAGFQPAIVSRTVGDHLECTIDLAGADVQQAICLVAAGNAFGGIITYATNGELPRDIVTSYLAEGVPMLPVLCYTGAELACWVEVQGDVATFILPGTEAQEWDYCQEFDIITLASSDAVGDMELSAEWVSNFRVHYPAGQDVEGAGTLYDWGLPFMVYNV